MRTLKIFIIVLLIVLVGLSIKFFPLGQKLYVLATLDDPDRIVRNLRDMEKIAEHRVIDKSSAPYSLPRALPATDRRFALPKTFESLGKTFETAAFLDETQSTGILILHNGKVVYEDYARGLTETITHSAFSVSKSFTSALVGLAIDDGYIGSEHDPVVEYLPGLKGTGYDGVTIAQCMEMASGAKFSERYDGAESDMDRFKRHFALGRPIIDFLKTIEPGKKPGSYNGYNSLDAQVVGMVVDAAIGKRTLSEYLREKIWQPVGMADDAQWLVDGTGIELSLGGLNVTLRDLAKFGQLFLQKGEWNGTQIIPATWVETSIKPDAPHLMPGRDNPLSDKIWGFKYLWWTPVIPFGGDYFASGLFNQHIYINPRKKLVIAKTTANHHYTQAPEQWKEHYIDLFQTIARSID